MEIERHLLLDEHELERICEPTGQDGGVWKQSRHIQVVGDYHWGCVGVVVYHEAVFWRQQGINSEKGKVKDGICTTRILHSKELGMGAFLEANRTVSFLVEFTYGWIRADSTSISM